METGTVIISGSLLPSNTNVPTNARSRINTLADVESIELPAIGEIFYCIENKTLYVITGLKSKEISGITLPDSVVATYKEVCQGGDGSSITVDSSLSDESTNPVQNRVITAEITSVRASIDQTNIELTNAKNTIDTVSSKVDSANSTISTKQDKLVSGTNIKTINGQSLLGSGDVTVSGDGVVIDTIVSSSSKNPVTSSGIYQALSNKVDKVQGKQLSTNDFTSTYKYKLDTLETTIFTAVDQRLGEFSAGNVVLTQDEYDALPKYDATKTYVIIENDSLLAIYIGAFLIAYRGSGESGDSQFPYSLPIIF